jgi:DNA-binding transcriptional ArsR family regulator
MAKLLPFRRSDTSVEPSEPRLVELNDDIADDVFSALSAGTAREILKRLYQEPGTATDVADAADTSLQNARYHLEKLQDAGLVDDVDIWYSSRGTEMTVYAPTNEPLVVAAGPDEQTNVLRSALGRLVGALGILGLASLFVDRLARSWLGVFESKQRAVETDGGDGGDVEMLAEDVKTTDLEAGVAASNGTDSPSPTPSAEATQTVTEQATGTPMASPTPEATQTVVQKATRTATTSPTPVPTRTPEPTAVVDAESGLVEMAGGFPPGGLFFLGGLVVLGSVAGWWYFRRYRPLYG